MHCLGTLFWSDEAHFTVGGTVNKSLLTIHLSARGFSIPPILRADRVEVDKSYRSYHNIDQKSYITIDKSTVHTFPELLIVHLQTMFHAVSH